MASERLFGNNIRPACKYCEHVFQKIDDERAMCDKYGIISENHKCRHFYYDPLKRVPPKPIPLEKFDSSDFQIE